MDANERNPRSKLAGVRGKKAQDKYQEHDEKIYEKRVNNNIGEKLLEKDEEQLYYTDDN